LFKETAIKEIKDMRVNFENRTKEFKINIDEIGKKVGTVKLF
jgi:hypothetical protein